MSTERESVGSLTDLFLKVLRPIVRLAIKHKVSHAQIAEVLRKAYVDEAYENFNSPNKKMTVSRVAVLTGLSRKEVARLSRQEESAQPRVAPQRATRVINGWMTDSTNRNI